MEPHIEVALSVFRMCCFFLLILLLMLLLVLCFSKFICLCGKCMLYCVYTLFMLRFVVVGCFCFLSFAPLSNGNMYVCVLLVYFFPFFLDFRTTVHIAVYMLFLSFLALRWFTNMYECVHVSVYFFLSFKKKKLKYLYWYLWVYHVILFWA